jgi:phage-related tail fiber protein
MPTWKDTVRAATTANIVLSGTLTVDGVALAAGDRILVKDQTQTSDNGIYVVASGAWTRAVDANTSALVSSQMSVRVAEGTVNGGSYTVHQGRIYGTAGKEWILVTPDPITLGTTALTFVQSNLFARDTEGQFIAFEGLATTNGDAFSISIQGNSSPLATAIAGYAPLGTGVHGRNGQGSSQPPSAGVGVYGDSDGGSGVYGASTSGIGVVGVSQSGAAAQFDGAVSVNDTKDEDALGSTSGSSHHAAVAAHNNSGGFAFWGNSDSKGGIGIYARGATAAAQFDGAVSVNDTNDEGTFRSTSGSSHHAAVAATNNSGGFAFWGNSDSKGGTGIYARGANLAALFDGAVQVNGNINMGGGDVVFSDCAERFDLSADAIAEPGAVMVIADDGKLEPSSLAYDKRVAGVASGAGDFRPGIILGVTPDSQRRRAPVALAGKVYCKVDASTSPIAVGDMLTTSLTAGHAMKACDPARAFGAVIGKALQPLATGTGLIPILIALQ